jgi:hypothetical protein
MPSKSKQQKSDKMPNFIAERQRRDFQPSHPNGNDGWLDLLNVSGCPGGLRSGKPPRG